MRFAFFIHDLVCIPPEFFCAQHHQHMVFEKTFEQKAEKCASHLVV
jgi:hypothetical protein